PEAWLGRQPDRHGRFYRPELAVYKREVVSNSKQLDLALGHLALLQSMYSLAQIGDGAPPREREDSDWCLADVACTKGEINGPPFTLVR
ncbi:hypothetical protein, partial [Thiocapsa marina]